MSGAYRKGFGRGIQILGLISMVIFVSALLWRSGDLPESHSGVDVGIDPGNARSDQLSESAAYVSTGVATVSESLWVEIDESALSVLPPYPDDWSVDGRALVQVVDIDALQSAQVGDSLPLPVPQLGVTFQAVIEEVDEAVGARALVGSLSDSDGVRRSSVVTIGSESLFAFINTPNGTYELAIDTDRYEHGWLVPTSSMLADWDFGQPDYFDVQDEEFGAGAAP